MSIFQHWQDQKDSLRAALNDRSSVADVLYHLRHALLQTEQNALAEIGDQVLRQQAGILLSAFKGSLELLGTAKSTQIWVAQPAASPVQQNKLQKISAALLAAAAVLCGFRDEWLAMLLVLAAAAAGIWMLWAERKNAATDVRSNIRVELGVDLDQLLTVMDNQFRAADRYLEDFSYLNEQANASAEHTDTLLLSRAASLMEALYDCSDEDRKPVEESARQLLLRLGLEAVDYTEDNGSLFNALPSKSMTRTLSPAIVSAKEQKLLRRGTAAVRIGAA